MYFRFFGVVKRVFQLSLPIAATLWSREWHHIHYQCAIQARSMLRRCLRCQRKELIHIYSPAFGWKLPKSEPISVTVFRIEIDQNGPDKIKLDKIFENFEISNTALSVFSGGPTKSVKCWKQCWNTTRHICGVENGDQGRNPRKSPKACVPTADEILNQVCAKIWIKLSRHAATG